MKKNVYLLYRTEYGRFRQGRDENGKSIYGKQDVYYYFNSGFVEHRLLLCQLFASYRWYESVYGQLFKSVQQNQLKWTSVIHFNWFTIWIARFFALCMKGRWYKINKVQVMQ